MTSGTLFGGVVFSGLTLSSSGQRVVIEVVICISIHIVSQCCGAERSRGGCGHNSGHRYVRKSFGGGLCRLDGSDEILAEVQWGPLEDEINLWRWHCIL